MPQQETRRRRGAAASRSGARPPAMATRPPSRQGKKPVTAYVDKQVHKQLRSLGLELEKSNQEMILEALNDYFARHGLSTKA
ncbi:MAG: hypothetical protein GWM88_07575 [Pseudomonadales bacterium]|nr:hypothetical protein [Pseudomonadales bacterium]NIX07868.1 hypothetical protein [Pseudomonadales bacterium]